MVFILSDDGRDDDFPGVTTAFERYGKYLKSNKAAFPERAFQLATSEWFYNPKDHQCPHDAWLESFQILESAEGEDIRRRACKISLRLLGAYHDGHIEIAYPKVFSYSLLSFTPGIVRSHGDWRYDEFRLSERGHLIHEIEWAVGTQVKAFSWTIEAEDIEFRWIPKDSTPRSQRLPERRRS